MNKNPPYTPTAYTSNNKGFKLKSGKVCKEPCTMRNVEEPKALSVLEVTCRLVSHQDVTVLSHLAPLFVCGKSLGVSFFRRSVRRSVQGSAMRNKYYIFSATVRLFCYRARSMVPVHRSNWSSEYALYSLIVRGIFHLVQRKVTTIIKYRSGW